MRQILSEYQSCVLVVRGAKVVDTLPLLAEDLSMWMGERLPIVVLGPDCGPSASLAVGIGQDGGSDEVVFSVPADLLGAGGEATSSGCPG